jgi:hypothetical protein
MINIQGTSYFFLLDHEIPMEVDLFIANLQNENYFFKYKNNTNYFMHTCILNKCGIIFQIPLAILCFQLSVANSACFMLQALSCEIATL